jgi:hypothetical protein
MNWRVKCLAVAATVAFVLALGGRASLAGWGDIGKTIQETLSGSNAASGSTANPTQDEMVRALKQALSQAVEKSIANLGQTDGFLGNPEVRIPIPEKLQSAETVLRRVGQGELADEFIASMNHAAEKAVPETVDIFSQSLSAMTLEDAQGIVKGPDDAATQYFDRTSRATLKARIMPIVKQAMDEAQVTRYYRSMTAGLGTFAAPLGFSEQSLDDYVADKGLDGLFTIMAQEEQRIRENPVARSSELMQKVFGWAKSP